MGEVVAIKDDEGSDTYWIARVVKTPEAYIEVWYMGTHGRILRTAPFKPLYHVKGGTRLTFGKPPRKKRKLIRDSRWTGRVPVTHLPALVIARKLKLTGSLRLTARSCKVLSSLVGTLTHAVADDPKQG